MTEAPYFPLAREGCPWHPSAGYAKLREQDPIVEVRLPAGDPAWLVTGYAEARALFADQQLSPDPTDPAFPAMRAPGGSQDSLEVRRAARSFNQLDGPEHAAHRKLLIPSLTVRRTRKLAPPIQDLADGLITELLAEGPGADLVAKVAVPLPPMIFSVLFGVPEEDREFFESRARRSVTDAASAGEALSEVSDLVSRLVEERAARPGDDLLSEMAVGAERRGLTHDRLVNTAMVLLVAGNESTLSMIALGTLALLSHPEQADTVRADPGATAAKAVEELLRFLSVADTVPRAVRHDVEVGRRLIRAGDSVLLPTPAVNRDPSVFRDPDDLDVHRPAGHHVAFGYGVHQCIGQNLARVVLQIVFTRLFERMPALGLADAASTAVIDAGVGVPRISRLRVTW